MQPCPNCKNVIPKTARFCVYCGYDTGDRTLNTEQPLFVPPVGTNPPLDRTNLAVKPAPITPPMRGGRNTGRPLVLTMFAGIGVLVLAVAGVLAVVLLNSNSARRDTSGVAVGNPATTAAPASGGNSSSTSTTAAATAPNVGATAPGNPAPQPTTAQAAATTSAASTPAPTTSSAGQVAPTTAIPTTQQAAATATPPATIAQQTAAPPTAAPASTAPPAPGSGSGSGRPPSNQNYGSKVEINNLVKLDEPIDTYYLTDYGRLLVKTNSNRLLACSISKANDCQELFKLNKISDFDVSPDQQLLVAWDNTTKIATLFDLNSRSAVDIPNPQNQSFQYATISSDNKTISYVNSGSQTVYTYSVAEKKVTRSFDAGFTPSRLQPFNTQADRLLISGGGRVIIANTNGQKTLDKTFSDFIWVHLSYSDDQILIVSGTSGATRLTVIESQSGQPLYGIDSKLPGLPRYAYWSPDDQSVTVIYRDLGVRVFAITQNDPNPIINQELNTDSGGFFIDGDKNYQLVILTFDRNQGIINRRY